MLYNKILALYLSSIRPSSIVSFFNFYFILSFFFFFKSFCLLYRDFTTLKVLWSYFQCYQQPQECSDMSHRDTWMSEDQENRHDVFLISCQMAEWQPASKGWGARFERFHKRIIYQLSLEVRARQGRCASYLWQRSTLQGKTAAGTRWRGINSNSNYGTPGNEVPANRCLRSQ